jgi:rhodanese-related sulfurtransferase
MSSIADILATAHQRHQAKQLPYAGAVTPQEAYELILGDAKIKLIDIRTNAELDWVGTVHIAEAQYAEIQWSFYPSGSINPDFLAELEKTARKDDVVLFLCRSGVRSHHAAQLAAKNGYIHCFDVLEGFEGDMDANGHRKTVGGWCKSGLPWHGI